jgi:hypothetical protein
VVRLICRALPAGCKWGDSEIRGDEELGLWEAGEEEIHFVLRKKDRAREKDRHAPACQIGRRGPRWCEAGSTSGLVLGYKFVSSEISMVYMGASAGEESKVDG